jgi:hypothetical protein
MQLPEYLAKVTGVPLRRIVEARNVRNRIAHDGTYTEAKTRRAALTIGELENALAAASVAAAPHTATARVVFYRPLRWTDAAGSYGLRVDGLHRGNIRVNQELTVEIPPGLHTAEARCGRSGSPLIEFDAQPSQIIRIKVKPADIVTMGSGMLRFDRETRIQLSFD